MKSYEKKTHMKTNRNTEQKTIEEYNTKQQNQTKQSSSVQQKISRCSPPVERQHGVWLCSTRPFSGIDVYLGVSNIMHMTLNDPVPKVDIRVWLGFLVKTKIVLKSALGSRGQHLLRPLPYRLVLLPLLGDLPGVVVGLPHPPDITQRETMAFERERERAKRQQNKRWQAAKVRLSAGAGGRAGNNIFIRKRGRGACFRGCRSEKEPAAPAGRLKNRNRPGPKGTTCILSK